MPSNENDSIFMRNMDVEILVHYGYLMNYENQVRVAGLKDYMRSHGIAYQEQGFYYRSYAYQCGVHGFEYLYEAFLTDICQRLLYMPVIISQSVCVRQLPIHGLKVLGFLCNRL